VQEKTSSNPEIDDVFSCTLHHKCITTTQLTQPPNFIDMTTFQEWKASLFLRDFTLLAAAANANQEINHMAYKNKLILISKSDQMIYKFRPQITRRDLKWCHMSPTILHFTASVLHKFLKSCSPINFLPALT
jgi:hypothetical protein